MQTKKNGITNQTKASLQEAFKCGECLHFKQNCHSSHPQVCSKMGVRHFAIAPKCFTPDYTRMFANVDEFVMLSALLANKTAAQKRLMLGMLRQQPSGKRMALGTKVYLNVRGREYVGNYLCGYVVGYTSAGQIVLGGTPDRKSRGRMFFAYLKDDTSLLNEQEWRKRYALLTEKGRINDPKAEYVRDITAKVKEDTYEVPTIDNAPKEAGPKQKINKRTTSLVQILSF